MNKKKNKEKILSYLFRVIKIELMNLIYIKKNQISLYRQKLKNNIKGNKSCGKKKLYFVFLLFNYILQIIKLYTFSYFFFFFSKIINKKEGKIELM